MPGLAEASASADVRAYGASGNGQTKDTRAIQAAIDSAAASGRAVHFPRGNYLSGTLHLRDRTTLQIDAGARLIASPDDDDFDRAETHGYDTFADEETSDQRFALLQGREVKQLRIVGSGSIDGNRWKREGPKPIALRGCRGIEIRDLTIANAGNYGVSLVGCEHVDIEGVTILNGYADGIDPDSCRDVRIARCHIDTRDDALCLKASLALGARGATERVRVFGCHLATRHNAIKLGTESSGDFRDIVIRDCTIVGKRHPSPWKGDLTSGIALMSVDGGVLERVTVQNIRMASVRTPIFVRLARRGRGQRVPTAGALRHVSIKDVQVGAALGASSITGIPGAPIGPITLQNLTVEVRGGGTRHASLQVPEKETRYPDGTMFADLPAYGLYCRHATGLVIEDANLGIDQPDARPAVVLDDVSGVHVRRLHAVAPIEGGPMLWLHAVRDAELRDLHPRAGSTVARISGPTTAGIRLDGHEGPDAVVLDRDLSPTALQRSIGTSRQD